jgi:C4-dicarboxylate-specific signal transduction histidine kinase
MSIVFVRKITEPIEELSNMAQKVKDGNYAVRSDIKSSDEMEILAKAFNDMLDTIEENINTLDMKVKTRTVELENRLHELRQAQAQLVQSEKLASLGSMVAGVAHEINTPVGMALTGTTHLNDETKELKRLYDADEISEEDFDEYVNNASNLAKSILINLQRAIQLVRSFKQVAVDQSSYEVRKFYLREYIYEILDSLHNRIKKTHHNIRVEVDKSLELNSIPGIFSQILTNFIMNSLIHGFKDTKSGQITIKAHKSNENVILIYEDNGVGLSNTVQERIFDPFFTTNRENGGSGLGMNIVYNLVTRKLNGSISARNGEEGGVVFIIDVPLVTTITPQEES